MQYANMPPLSAPTEPFFAPTSPKETSTVSPPVTRNNSVSSSGQVGEEELKNHQEAQLAFGANREALVTALDSTALLVKGLQAFNQEKWTIHYPHQLGVASTAGSSRASTSSAPSSPRSAMKGARPSGLRRSASMFLDEVTTSDSDDTDGESSSSSKRPSLSGRSYTTTTSLSRSGSSSSLSPPHPLSILSLDLKLGHPSSPTATLPALLPSLSLATLSQLLSRRLTTSLAHLTALRARVIDTSSRILVTGDLNAGKSTLVNALLRREVMPSDQQPCTTVFCEVLDAESYNTGKEELHAIKDMDTYDLKDPSTFDVFSLDQVNEMQDMSEIYQIVKAYVTDARGELSKETKSEGVNPSFIKNGLVSISLIDAPGLNRDTLSTTALFARQSEIDVIVFVVSAENHFTLSAKEFLWNASREKAYVFVVVNKWKAIKDKARCMRIVGEQIQQLSPATWEARNELVHFVDAAEVMGGEDVVADTDSFDHLEQSLRSFVLLKRSKSKLAPARHYLLNLLSDLSTLVDANVIAADTDCVEALRQLELVKPIHDRLSAQRDEVDSGVDSVEESVVETVKTAAWTRLERAIAFVSEGEVIPPTPTTTARTVYAGVDSLQAPTVLPPYPGVLGIWGWATEVKKTLVQALESEVRSAEDEARTATVGGVKQVMTDLGDKYLPGTGGAVEEKEKNERVFRPEVMFAKRRRGVGRLAAKGVSAGLGLGTNGLGGGWTATDFEVSFLDLFDLERFYNQGKKLGPKSAVEDDALEKGALISLGMGGIGMIGSRLIGIKGTVEGISRVFEVLGSNTARKWAAPVIGILTVGLAVYVVIDLPRAIPYNIGRKLLHSLSSSSDASAPTTSFSLAHSDRIARETRKVLRLAGWDLRERFRAALEKSTAERKEVELKISKAEGALTWLEDFGDKVEKEQERVKCVELEV